MADKLRETMQRMARNIPKGGFSSGGGSGGGGGDGGVAGAAASAAMALIAAGALGYGAYHSVYTVQGGHRAIMFNRLSGMKENVYGEGLNFNIPWFERPYIFDIRTRPVNLQTLTGSKDLQMVTIGVRVLHKPDPKELVWIYQNLGKDYDERVLPSIMNECAKAVVARYNANELLTRREMVSADISRELAKRAANFNVILEDVAITHLSFSPEYAKAVENKQVGTSLTTVWKLISSHSLFGYLLILYLFVFLVTHTRTAQQEAEKAKYIVLGAIQEKETIITRARGEAESAMLIGQAVKKNPGFMKLRRIDAAREIADVVSGSGNKIYLNADSLLLNLLGDTDDKFEKGMSSKSNNEKTEGASRWSSVGR